VLRWVQRTRRTRLSLWRRSVGGRPAHWRGRPTNRCGTATGIRTPVPWLRTTCP